MKELKPKYFLYARKSTEDDDHQIMSIEAQLFELHEYARRENLEILEEFQESKSAKKPGRELFNEMMARIDSMDGVGILAWHPDRLARNSVDGGRIIYAVDTNKIVSFGGPLLLRFCSVSGLSQNTVASLVIWWTSCEFSGTKSLRNCSNGSSSRLMSGWH